MSLLLGCIADDYTGASDVASVLRSNGLRTIQTIGVPSADLALGEVDAVVVSFKSRSIAPGAAVAMSLEAETWLREHGAAHILFKVCSTFDSTDRGNIGPVMDALRQRTGCGPVIVTPAFPENHRSVFQGLLFVNGVPLHESSMKDHPINPMRDSNLVRLLSRQSATTVGLMPFATVEGGPDAIRAAVRAARDDGHGAMIADAVLGRHLDALAIAALETPLSVGASGLGAGLARLLVKRNGLTGMPGHLLPATTRPPGPFAAFLAGSCSSATRLQVETAANEGTPYFHLDIAMLLGGNREHAVREVTDRAIKCLADGPVLIASSDTPDRVGEIQAAHGQETSGHAIEQAFADIAQSLVDAGVGRLVIAGGETSGAIVDRLGLEAFVVGPEIAPGVPAMRTIGRNRAGLALALKSGNFGDRNFFQHALRML